LRRLLLASVAALSVLTATAAAHAETKEARVILPDTITGTWCWVEGVMRKTEISKSLFGLHPKIVMPLMVWLVLLKMV
jgi:hypothetical protein